LLPTEVKDDDHQRSSKTDKVEPPDIGHYSRPPSASSFFPFLGPGRQSFQLLGQTIAESGGQMLLFHKE